MEQSCRETWISVADTAVLLKIKPSTVIRRIEKGTLPSRTSADTPFTYDGKPNYEVRLDVLPQRLQYQYLYSHLPASDVCSLDLVSPRSVLGNVWLDEFLDISSLIRSATRIRQQHHSTGHITDELRKLADSHGISLATLYRLTGKPSSTGISSLYTDPFYLQNHLPSTMCLWSCDLAYALYLDSENMNFEDHIRAKQKLKEAYTQREFLLLYGYSGCGKTTILTQFAEKYSNYIFLLRDFDSLSPAQMLVEMGECINMPIKLRTNEMSTLKHQIAALQGVMFLFDEVTAFSNSAFRKLEMLRRIHDETHVPIVICGVPLLHKTIYASNRFDHYCSLISRMDEYEMHGMKRSDAGNYIEMVAREENVRFSYPAQQALITTALNAGIGGINAFTTIIGRCITLARVHYYNSPGHTIPDKTRCVRTETPGDTSYPGAKLILTLPVTPEPVLISEQMVSDMQSEYKSHFPRVQSKKHPQQTPDTATQST